MDPNTNVTPNTGIIGTIETSVDIREVVKIKRVGSPILDVLEDSLAALTWVNTADSGVSVPEAHTEKLKRLEKLGIIFKRNNTTFGLRKQRLRKLLEREAGKVSIPEEVMALCATDA